MNRGSRIILGVAPPLLRQAALGALVVRSAGTNDNTNREEDHISLQTFGVKETFMPRWINRTLVVLRRFVAWGTLALLGLFLMNGWRTNTIAACRA